MHGAGLPEIINYPSSVQMINGEVDVWAECNGTMDKVWFRIFPDNYYGLPPVNQLPYVEMPHATGFRYEGTYNNINFIQPGTDYEIHIGAVADIFNYAVPRIIPLEIISLGLSEKGQVPLSYYLDHCYPNPFNPSTTIQFGLRETVEVQISIYNVLGQRIRELISQRMVAGHHKVTWDGRSDSGNMVGSGIYFYHIEAGDFMKTHKMIMMK
jgi:hypothetical protein